MPLLPSLLIILLLILCSAFFSSSETALTAISRARIYRLVMDGNTRATLVSKLRREKELMIGTILMGNTAVNILAGSVATTVAIQYYGDNAVWLVTVVLTIVLLVFGEVMPKTFAIQNAERVSLTMAPLLYVLVRLSSPLTRSIQWFNRRLLGLFGIDITRAETLVSATDVLRGTIELHHREGQMVKQDRDMLGSILDLNDIEVRAIMIHRKQAETLNAGLPVQELLNLAARSAHSRIPLWKDNPDNIVGVLHMKNLVRALNDKIPLRSGDDIIALANKPWFIPETTNLRDQLIAFREKRQHLALVVDEYGGWLGIVTLEDIIEEIVGDIGDEYDRGGSLLVNKLADNTYLVHGTVTVRDLNRQLDWHLPDEHASTVAGLVIYEARFIPDIGATFEFNGYRFTVEEKRANQITRVRVEKLPEPIVAV